MRMTEAVKSLQCSGSKEQEDAVWSLQVRLERTSWVLHAEDGFHPGKQPGLCVDMYHLMSLLQEALQFGACRCSPPSTD